ncbi:protein-L-isoaspartate(D-aspartate) O-methyltransferase [Nonomuraea sp. NPDC050153]|uniref:protein-L-isoaspartate(D-aspartate) O-methyltransferase n=1 Tax=Nonomuraea sp. NPDC050153 TaxID=3364359 RepID=UPI0037A9929E
MSAQIEEIFEPLGIRWVDALRANPRAEFIPEQAWAHPDGDDTGRLINRSIDPADWEKVVGSNVPIITQIDDGRAPISVGGDGFYTSSCSMPSIVAAELELLGLKRDDDVLEIGTGTGWTAGLISHYVKHGRVVTIEVDEEIHSQAVRNLARARSSALPVFGDGMLGYPDGAPYDAVHVTVGSTCASPAWIAQTRPGGTVVFPWMPAWSSHGGTFVALRPLGDGTAVGRFGPGCTFMMIRSQRDKEQFILGEDWRERPARIDPQRLVGEWAAVIALAATLPGVSCSAGANGGGFILYAYTDAAAARVAWNEDAGDWIVRYGGDRDLYAEAEEAFTRWLSLGSPAAHRYGYTSTPDGDTIWLDTPAHVVGPF